MSAPSRYALIANGTVDNTFYLAHCAREVGHDEQCEADWLPEAGEWTECDCWPRYQLARERLARKPQA